MGIEFVLKGIPLLKPRVYHLGAIKKPPVIIYSDAEWTVVDDPPSIKKGLGGIQWQAGELPYAAAVDTPQICVDSLSKRKNTDYSFGADGSSWDAGYVWTFAQR